MALELTPASSDPLQVVDVAALDEDEAAYVRAARAAICSDGLAAFLYRATSIVDGSCARPYRRACHPCRAASSKKAS